MDEGWYIESIIQGGKSQGVGRKVFVLIWFRENDSDCEIFGILSGRGSTYI